MNIRIRPYFFIRRAMGGRACIEMECDRMTVGQLLQKLGLRYGRKFSDYFFDGDNLKTTGGALILVNGRNLRNLPDQLDTELQDDDDVVLFPPAMGG